MQSLWKIGEKNNNTYNRNKKKRWGMKGKKERKQKIGMKGKKEGKKNEKMEKKKKAKTCIHAEALENSILLATKWPM